MPPPAPPADADAVLAAEQAAEASALWVGTDFDAAHQTLQRLEATLPTDARVQLNLWVSGYYADAGSSLDTLAKELAGWLKAHPSSPTNVGQYNTHAVAAVNYGLILFLQQQHATALSVLEPLFEEVDILQDGTALCLCTLLLEVYLDCCQLPKAVEVLQYLQAQATAARPAAPTAGDGSPVAGAAAGDAGSSSSNQGSPLAPGSSDRGSRSPAKQPQQEGQQAAGAAGGGEVQSGGQQQGGDGQHDAAVPLSQALPVLSKTKGQRMQEVFQLVQQQGGKPSGQDLAPLLHLYKARLALACQNHKAAKKEVRGLLSCEPDSPAAVLLKAQLEASRQQPRKALKTLGPLLTAAHQQTIRCRLQLLNLLAAIHAQLDKHHLAALYLSTALELHAEVQEQQQPKPPASKPDPQQQRKQQGKRQQQKKQQQQQGTAAAGEQAQPAPPAPGAGVPRKSHWLLQDMSDALSYNLGLQQLALQDWQGAMDSFEAASSKFFTLPQLWLRWAEACLGLYHQQLQQQRQQQAGQQVAAGAGSSAAAGGGKGKAGGKQGKGQAGKKQQQQQQQQQQQGSSPELLLHQAAAHLSTGLVLLQERQAAAAKQLEAATAAAAAAIAAGEPSPDVAVGQPWPLMDPLTAAAAGAAPGGTAPPGDSSSSPTPAGTAAGSSSAAAGTSGGSASSASAGASSTPSVGSGVPGDAALLAPELAAVRQGLLSNKAYVALQLGQPQEALEAAQELVACSRMSPQQHYLGTSYAAEALCLLGRVEEAKLQLQAHMGMFMQHSSGGSGSGGGGLLAGAGDAGPGSSSSASAAQHPAAGPAPAAAAAAPPSSSDAAVAGSTKSFDGSCVSCSKGVCGHAGQAGGSGAGGGLTIQDQAALLHNMGAVLVLQGQHEEGHRHAAIAAALHHAGQHGTQQDADTIMRAYAASQGL